MKTHLKLMKTVIRFATSLALFASFTLAADPVSAQNGKNKGNSGGGKQAISQSSSKSNPPKVNKSDKTLRQGKSISAGPGPMPTVDRDDKHRGQQSMNITSGSSGSGNGSVNYQRSNKRRSIFADGFESGDTATHESGASNWSFGAPNRGPSEIGFKSTAKDSRSIYPTEVQRRGVATGDFNRDGLDDLVQTSNRVQTPKRDFGDRAVKWMGPEFDALTNPSGQSLTGQDQETGEMITYPNATNFKRRK